MDGKRYAIFMSFLVLLFLSIFTLSALFNPGAGLNVVWIPMLGITISVAATGVGCFFFIVLERVLGHPIEIRIPD
jgi:hypothetical protein